MFDQLNVSKNAAFAKEAPVWLGDRNGLKLQSEEALESLQSLDERNRRRGAGRGDGAKEEEEKEKKLARLDEVRELLESFSPQSFSHPAPHAESRREIMSQIVARGQRLLGRDIGEEEGTNPLHASNVNTEPSPGDIELAGV